MNYLRNILLSSFIVLIPFIVKSQEVFHPISLSVVEDSLKALMNIVYSDTTTSIKEKSNINLIDFLKKTLTNKAAFDYPFDSLKHIGRIISKDKKIRIFTWNVPQPNGYQVYYGFVLVKGSKGKVQLHELKDNRKSITNPIKDILGVHNWMGTLYYSIDDITYKGQTYYILLGLDFNSLFSSKKIIEALTFGKEMQPIFGSNIFMIDNTLLSRVVFEFSARATMMLRFIPESKTIVFDHLSPSRPDFAGNYQFYGPDFTYDGFRFEKGKWMYVRDLDLRNSKREPGKLKTSPEKFPDPGFLYKSKGGIPNQIVR